MPRQYINFSKRSIEIIRQLPALFSFKILMKGGAVSANDAAN